jgi:hypothetical protein
MSKFKADLGNNEKDYDSGDIMYDAEVAVPAPAQSSRGSKRVKLDLEVDASAIDIGVNPYSKIIHLARAVDSWRIFPRIFLTTYIVLLYKSVIWFMELPDPNLEQSGLISVVVGAGAAWFGLYAGTSKNIKQ